jgi:hypothetical protein
VGPPGQRQGRHQHRDRHTSSHRHSSFCERPHIPDDRGSSAHTLAMSRGGASLQTCALRSGICKELT